MRFLVDECLSARIVTLLDRAGHDAVHVSDCALLGRSDDEVLQAARGDDRILLSADTDFGLLLAQSGDRVPSVVLFRQGNRSPEHRATTLMANLDQVASDLEAGAVVVFTDDRIRVRRLPLG